MNLIEAKRQSRLLIGIVLLAGLGLWVYYAYVLRPMFGRFVRLGQESKTARIQLQHIRQAVSQEPQLRQEHVQLTEAVQALRKALPPEEELPSIIELLSDVAAQTGLKIQTIFPQRASAGGFELLVDSRPPQPELYKEIPVQIDALVGFHQLGSFLSRVESEPQPIQLKILRVTTNPKEPRRHNVKLVLNTYFATSKAKPGS